MVDFEFIQRATKFLEPERDEKTKYVKTFTKKRNAIYRESRRKYSSTEKGKIAAVRRNCTSAKRFLKFRSELSKQELEDIKTFYLKCPNGSEVDHITPLSKGGKHHISNLQYLTVSANREKSSKSIEQMQTEFRNLLSGLETLTKLCDDLKK